jgi:hypothetical protein
MKEWQAARIIWEARKIAAWGKTHGQHLIDQTPWQSHPAHPLVAVEHELAVAEIRALLKHCTLVERKDTPE